MERQPHEERRPLYHEFAWAYDLLFGLPRETIVEAIAEELEVHGIEPGSSILDAGCGTAGYALALADRGFRVTAIDRSHELIDQGRRKVKCTGSSVSFRLADLRYDDLGGPFDAVLARGVLNDFLTDRDRGVVVAALFAALREGGVLIADVRDWQPSRERYARRSTSERSVSAGPVEVTLRSETQLDDAAQQLRIREHMSVVRNGRLTHVDNDFVMRCWSPGELRTRLDRAGFRQASTRPADRPDRILAIASR